MTVSEKLETMHENDLYDMFPELLPWYISLSDTCYTVFCGKIIQYVVQIENLQSAAPWGNNVSVTSYLLTLIGHMPTLKSTMTRIVSSISSAVEIAETAISFNLFYELI